MEESTMKFVELMEEYLAAEKKVRETEPILKDAVSRTKTVGEKIFNGLQQRNGKFREYFHFIYQERSYSVNSYGEIYEKEPLPALEQLDESGVDKTETA